MPSAFSKHWSRWTLFLAFWTLVGLSFAIHFFLNSSKTGRSVSWSDAVTFSLADWYVFALLSIPAGKLARRFPFERRNWGRVVLVHLIYSVLFSFAFMVLRAGVSEIQNWMRPGTGLPFARGFALLTKTFQYNIWVYWVILSVCHAFDYYQKFHERELRAAELEKRLTQAKLQALQSQMNPHFLFNTLHTISALMHKDVEAADRMVMKLSDLLRMALDNTDAHEVPLTQELDFLKRYLAIEQTRFRDRLTVELEIAPDTLRAQVPNLVLQPLVENAIRHGIEKHARPGRIVLRANRRDGVLELQVQDNGDGLPPGGAKREGIGISNTRSRLQQLYGAAQKFELQNLPAGGLLARVVIPFHEE